MLSNELNLTLFEVNEDFFFLFLFVASEEKKNPKNSCKQNKAALKSNDKLIPSSKLIYRENLNKKPFSLLDLAKQDWKDITKKDWVDIWNRFNHLWMTSSAFRDNIISIVAIIVTLFWVIVFSVAALFGFV